MLYFKLKKKEHTRKNRKVALGILSILFFDKSNSIKFSIPRKLLSTAVVMLFSERSGRENFLIEGIYILLLNNSIYLKFSYWAYTRMSAVRLQEHLNQQFLKPLTAVNQ